MRVMFFGAGMAMNGANLLSCRWAEHLRAQGHEVSVLTQDDETGPLKPRYEAAGIAVIADDQAYIDNQTLVICNTVLTAEMLVKAAAFSRCVWWIHEGEVGAGLLANYPQARQAFSCASAVIFPTAYMLDTVYRRFVSDMPRQKLFVVPNGVDAPRASRPRADGPVRVVSVGALCTRKRQGDLIRAVNALPDSPLQCQLAGKLESLDDEAHDMIRARPDRFHLMGEISHERSLEVIDGADILAHPSSDEALPLVLLEAGIRGKPLLLSNLPIYRDIWLHGENCLTHAVGDVALLAHLLTIFVRDGELRRRFGAAAQRTAQNFRSEVMLTKLDQVVAQVVGPSFAPVQPDGQSASRGAGSFLLD